MGSSNKPGIDRLSDHELVYSFITATWWRNLVNNPRDRGAYDICVKHAEDFRNELLRRLAAARDHKT